MSDDAKERDILEVLTIYKKRLEEFKREMKALGINVKVSASLGIYTSTVEEIQEGKV